MKKQRVDIKEACRLTGKSTNTIRNWIKSGKVDAVKRDKIWEIAVDSLPVDAEAAAPEAAHKPAPAVHEKVNAPVHDDSHKKREQELQQEIDRLRSENGRLQDEVMELRDKEDNMKENLRRNLGPLAPIAQPLIEKLLGIE